MKLVSKLAFALFVGVFVVVALFTALRVRNEINLFDQDARRDQRIVGLTAGAALSKTRTLEDAVRLANRVDASREIIQVRFVSLAPGADGALRPLVSIPPSDVPSAGMWKQVAKLREPNVEGSDILVTYVAAPVVDEPHGAIELSQPLASRAEYAWRGVWSALTSSLAMLLVGGVTVALIGARGVGRPVSELIHATRRIGEGDFRVLDSIQRRDEFGELARALRSMSSEIEAERHRTQREADARVLALEQLRHAERLTTLGQLASVLAHEIGTPLNVIAGHGKLIASGRLNSDGIAESAAAIGDQSLRITQIVTRILDYARRRPARRTSVDAAEIVRQACGLLRGLAEQRAVTLELLEPVSAMVLFADPDQLQQAITNLVLNAVHASPAGETVHIVLGSATLSVPGDEQRFVTISVQDHGPGVAAECVEKIFEPFYTTKSPGEGTGLGLSVVHDIVEEHGGRVEVSGCPGGGAMFTISLPMPGTNVV